MSSSELLKDRASATQVDVQSLRVVAAMPTTPRSRSASTLGLASAIAELGYPIARYLAQGNKNEELSAIFTRMRSCYFQNRDEFFSLRPLLEKKLMKLGGATLKNMAKLAENFVPMWCTPQKAAEPLSRLQR